MPGTYIRRFSIINGRFIQYNLRLPCFVTTYKENIGFSSLINFLEKLKVVNLYTLKDL